MSIKKDDRIKIKSLLQRGDINKIATLSKCSRITVYRFLKGEGNNEGIEESILRVLIEKKERKICLTELISLLIK